MYVADSGAATEARDASSPGPRSAAIAPTAIAPTSIAPAVIACARGVAATRRGRAGGRVDHRPTGRPA
jgi:hypothetical protein